ncbi:MAG: DNA polymerase I, partial [Gammaproteobacteria bacterium]|nr:DNA polymerase I [Gammaproteobacteria bacterium]
IEIPLSKTLAKMEHQGLRVDSVALSQYHISIEEELQKVGDEIYALAGHKFNILSPKQLGVVLFEEQGLVASKKTKTGYSTDSSVLEELASENEIVNKVLRYRFLSKLLQTYVVGVENAIKEKNDGHIHTIYKQAWTDTGRLSSIEPNLQNLPYRNEESKEFRKVFIAEDDSYLMSSDYSQIELRVLAHLAHEETLINAFKNGEDIHEATAKAILKKDSVTKDERRSAKAVNFGIIYGMSSWGLSNDIGISPSEAKKFIDRYHQTFPNIEPYTNSLIKEAQDTGYVKTIFNRRRYIRDINSGNYNLREFSKRTAMNAPIQGSAADILKLAMVRLDKAIEENHLHAKLILTIHDEVVLNVKKDEIDKVKALTESVLEGVVKLDVPLLVETEYGINLYEAK